MDHREPHLNIFQSMAWHFERASISVSMEEIRIVVVGDEKSGKSTLINRFISDSLPTSYKPTSFDKFLVTREISGTLYNLVVWDTSGSPNFDTVRPLSYGEADVFIVCFKVNSYSSYSAVQPLSPLRSVTLSLSTTWGLAGWPRSGPTPEPPYCSAAAWRTWGLTRTPSGRKYFHTNFPKIFSPILMP